MCWPIFSAKLNRFVRFDFLPEEVGGELVGFVEDDQVPRRAAQSFSWSSSLRDIWSSRTIRWSWSSNGLPLGEAASSSFEKMRNSRPNFSNSSSRHCSTRLPGATIRMRRASARMMQLADVETGHDGLAGAGIVGQDEAQRLRGQHRLVDGRDLVRQRVHVRRVDGHHRVEEEGQVDALGLDGELEVLAVAIEGPGAFRRWRR